MAMKKSIILLFVLGMFSATYAQNFLSDSIADNSSTPQADKLFKRMWYKEAAELYERELSSLDRKKDRDKDKKKYRNKNSEDDNYLRVLKKAGDAYYFNTDMENANR